MPNVPAIVSLTIQDEVGTKANLPVYVEVPDTVTVATLRGFSQTIAIDADAISGGKVIEIRNTLSIPQPVSGIKANPVAGSRVEQTGLFNFSQLGSKYRWPIDVPAIADTKLIKGRIDLTDADIIAFIAAMSTTASLIVPSSKWALALEGLLDAALTFRKHRKQLIKETFEEA